MYTKRVNDIRIRNKCQCLTRWEKSTKLFLNLRTIIVNKKELNDSQETNDTLYNFY